MKNIRKILIGLLLLGVTFLFIFAAVTRFSMNSKNDLSVVTTNFITYDLVRAVTGDAAEIKMLIKPGTETHSFEPSPHEIAEIEKADLFVYIGGESDTWVNKILHEDGIKQEKTLKLIDYVEPLREEGDEDHHEDQEGHENHEDGESHDDEYDEHIWTSPVNATKLVRAIAKKLSEIVPEKTAIFTENADAYIADLQSIDQEIRDVVARAGRKELIFADRFPFLYFVKEYGLSYEAAFPGCSEQTEASSKTIAELIEKVKSSGANGILKIELTSDKLAKTIAEETGVKIYEFAAGHNISQADFEDGKTYVDILRENVIILREVLR